MFMRFIAIITIFSFTLLSTVELKNCYIEKCKTMMHSAEELECDTCPICIATTNQNENLIPNKTLFVLKSIIPFPYKNHYQNTHSSNILRPPIA